MISSNLIILADLLLSSLGISAFEDGFGCVLVWVIFIFAFSMEDVTKFVMFEV